MFVPLTAVELREMVGRGTLGFFTVGGRVKGGSFRGTPEDFLEEGPKG